MEIDARTPDLVVVGVEGSLGDRAVLRWAAEEALAHHRHLCIYHCHPPAALTLTPATLLVPAALRDTESAARVLGESVEWVRDLYPTLEVSGTALEGSPGRRLAAHVREQDLLVLGLGTRHRFTARILGSTVEYVLQHARSTVVVVPPAGRINGGNGSFSGHVVAAIDNTDAASAVVGTGFAEAAAHEWLLAIVRVDNRVRETEVSATGLDAHLPRLDGAVESWHVRYPQVIVHKAIVGGTRGVALEHVCAGARMLVVGRASHPMRPVRLVDLLLSRINCPLEVTPLRVPADIAR